MVALPHRPFGDTSLTAAPLGLAGSFGISASDVERAFHELGVNYFFLTGRIVKRLGLVVLLTTVPVVMVGGFLWLAMAPTFAVLAIVMVTRRAGEYALARPGREMLFTVVAPDEKYKAKNVIDTAVYRGADAVSGWVKAGIDAIASSPAVVGLLGAVVALAWAGTGFGLARAQGRREAVATASAGQRG